MSVYSFNNVDEVSLERAVDVFREETGFNPAKKYSFGENFDCFRVNCKGSQKSLSIDNRKGKVLLHCFRCNKGWTPYSFLQEKGYKHIEILKKLDVKVSEEEKISANYKEQLITFCQQKYPTYKLMYQNIFTFAINDVQNAIGIMSATYYKNKKEYDNQVFNFVFKNHYKCKLIPINSGAPIYTFLYFNDDGKIQVCNSEFEKIPYNFDKFLKWIKNPNDERVLIITEGEKDVDTLMEKLNYGNRFLAISLKTGSRELHQLLFQMVFQKTNKVYFVGDNDLAGIEYRHRIYLLAKSYVTNFYVLRLGGMSRLGIGADVTDWYEYGMLNASKYSNIQGAFYKELFEYAAHDFQVSEYFESYDVIRGKKSIKVIPRMIWVNIRSFFEAHRMILRKDCISGKVDGDFGSLANIKDDTCEDGICYPELQRELMNAGWNVPQRKLEDFVKDYFTQHQYIEMLEFIKKTPLTTKYKKVKFHDDFNFYNVPPLMEYILDNIKFKSTNEKDIALQKIMIYKALLALPYMLENTAIEQRCIKADLRFVGGKAVGKTTFCKNLMTCYDEKGVQYNWFLNKGFLDLKNKDDRRLSFSSPCLILDEGVLMGSVAERKSYVEESVYYFTPKFTDIKAGIIRRNIIISSSNEMEHSTDRFNERRMWQIEVLTLPYLCKLSVEEYRSKKVFWNSNGVHEEHINHLDRTFHFPTMEFWRQMYFVYKIYENNGVNLEELTMLNYEEMKYYDRYMSDKISIPEEQREVEDMFGEYNWKNAFREKNTVQYITSKRMKDLVLLAKIAGRNFDMNKFIKNFKILIDGYGKNEELATNKVMFKDGSPARFYITPLFSKYFINDITQCLSFEQKMLFENWGNLCKPCTQEESMANDKNKSFTNSYTKENDELSFDCEKKSDDTTIST